VKDYRAAMLQSLVAVAWADQELHVREVEVIEGLIAGFGVSDEEAAIIREFSKSKHTLDDVPLSELSRDDRRLLIFHAVLLSYADGDTSDAERALIDDLIERLRIPRDEAEPLLVAAHERAKLLLPIRDRASNESRA